MTDHGTHDERPRWARRVRDERQARGWSQAEAVRALQAHANGGLPVFETVLRNWKRWESGAVEPDEFHKPLIAKTFGTVTGAFFPKSGNRDADTELISATGMNTLEIVSRLRVSDVSQATFDALRITVERLCSEYPHMSPEQLQTEGQAWLRRICSLLDRRLTLAQHQEVLSLAGMVTLLVGCVEYDMGQRHGAETTRKAALSLGEEAGNANVMGWAHEMRAWFAITQGDYRGVIAAAEAGQAIAPRHGVAVQLAAQRAKAWARIGDRREVEVALEEGRTLLETLPYPEDTDNHFVVDPAKFDYYAMDCYRLGGADSLAEVYADQVIEAATGFDGSALLPMRIAEANLTKGVVAARNGDLDSALAYGHKALSGGRKSIPSLLMVSRELRDIVRRDYADNPDGTAYLDELRTLASGTQS